MGRRQVVESFNAAIKGAFVDLGRGFRPTAPSATRPDRVASARQCDGDVGPQMTETDDDTIWQFPDTPESRLNAFEILSGWSLPLPPAQ